MAVDVKTAIQTEIQIWGKMSAIEAQHYIKKLKVCSLFDFIDEDLGGLSMKKISSYFAQTQSRCLCSAHFPRFNPSVTIVVFGV